MIYYYLGDRTTLETNRPENVMTFMKTGSELRTAAGLLFLLMWPRVLPHQWRQFYTDKH